MLQTKLLESYVKKRDLNQSSEPKAVLTSTNSGDFMIHLHDARVKHYDLRLQWKGVLKCWAIPKGPSLYPQDKRLAVRTEDHPDDYKSFEGVIPEKNYGAGPSLIWDAGEYIPLEDFEKGLKNGHLKILLDGVRLKGRWDLVRLKNQKKKENWLFIKVKDEFSLTKNKGAKQWDPENLQDSVATGRSLPELQEEATLWDAGSDVDDSNETREDFPAFIAPQLAYLEKKVPSGDWIYERKYDGYRLLAYLHDNKIRMMTRNGKDWTSKFGALCRALEDLPFDEVILDGEVVCFNPHGQSDFSLLQRYLQNAEDQRLDYKVFDILHIGGRNTRKMPLIQRRRIIDALFEQLQSDGLVGPGEVIQNGKKILEKACARNWEGLICKKLNSIYHSFRHRSWVKVKCTCREEFVIIGSTEPQGSRKHFGSLLLAEEVDGALYYRGRVGTGFNHNELSRLEKLLSTKKRKTPPSVQDLVQGEVKSWFSPFYYAEIEYTEKTKDGRLRHPTYQGLRLDKEFRRTKQITGSGSKAKNNTTLIQLSHPDRILFEQMNLSKMDLWNYYEQISENFLKWNRSQPLSLLRCPRGHTKDCFFQKHPQKQSETPPSIKIKEKNRNSFYYYLEDENDIKALVQLGVLEFHLWNSTVRNVDDPLYVVFDLDPGPGVSFDEVMRAAKDIREFLSEFKKESYVRSTGGKGLHVLTSCLGMNWEQAYEFSKSVAHQMVIDDKKRFVATSKKSLRKNKIFIDYLRNHRGATSIANYSTRARPGALVATPLEWSELNESFKPEKFSIKSVPKRLLALKEDPWQKFFNEIRTDLS